MPDYISKALAGFQHPIPTQPQHSPYKAAQVKYGVTTQLVKMDDTPILLPSKIKHIQWVVCTLLYYSQVVDPTLAVVLSTIASQQTNGIKAIMAACTQLLNYIATHPNASIRYCASDMILALNTDESYLTEPRGGKQGSRVHLPHKATRQWIPQRCNPCPLQYHQTHNDIRFWNLTCSAFLRLQGSCIPLHNARRTGPCTTPAKSSHNRQLNHRQTCDANDDPKSIKINGHAFPMAKMLVCATFVPLFVGQGTRQSGWLPEQTPPTRSPYPHASMLSLRLYHTDLSRRSLKIGRMKRGLIEVDIALL